MGETIRPTGGRKTGWPLALDTRDPDQLATFLTGLGYSEESVTDAVVIRCSIDRAQAQKICAQHREVRE